MAASSAQYWIPLAEFATGLTALWLWIRLMDHRDKRKSVTMKTTPGPSVVKMWCLDAPPSSIEDLCGEPFGHVGDHKGYLRGMVWNKSDDVYQSGL